VPTVPAQDPFYSQLSTNGPMGKSVADLAAMLTVMAGGDPRAPLSLRTEPVPFEAGLAAKEAPRIAWLADLDGRVPFEPGILELCATALGELGPAGWQVEDVSVPFPWAELWRSFVVLRHWAMSSRYGADYADPARRALLKPEMIYEIEGGMALSADDVSAAAKVRATLYQVALKLFERFDALAIPTAQVFPFPVEWRWPREVAGVEMDSYHRWMEAVVIGTMSGCPVVNVPVGFDEAGRPMGMQLIGRPRADRELLTIAAAYERDAARMAD
jgi:amidase